MCFPCHAETLPNVLDVTNPALRKARPKRRRRPDWRGAAVCPYQHTGLWANPVAGILPKRRRRPRRGAAVRLPDSEKCARGKRCKARARGILSRDQINRDPHRQGTEDDAECDASAEQTDRDCAASECHTCPTLPELTMPRRTLPLPWEALPAAPDHAMSGRTKPSQTLTRQTAIYCTSPRGTLPHHNRSDRTAPNRTLILSSGTQSETNPILPHLCQTGPDPASSERTTSYPASGNLALSDLNSSCLIEPSPIKLHPSPTSTNRNLPSLGEPCPIRSDPA